MFSRETGFSSWEDFFYYLAEESFPVITDNKKIEYLNIPAAFDIEVSSFYDKGQKRSCMYIWMLGINTKVIYGRAWKEFQNAIALVNEILGLNENRILTIYIHNLSYEFQFMRKLFKWDKVFLLEERKPLYCRCGGIQFKCSLKLSGKRLELVGQDLQRYKVEKLSGQLDYSKIRHSKTPLTKEELQYCENDIRVLLSYIQCKIEDDGDITRIPLTSTGYVRNHCRKSCFKYWRRYHDLMQQLTLEPEEYEELKRAFQGGFTHANAFYTTSVLHGIASYDFTSSYPAVMLSEKFPMGRGKRITENLSSEKLDSYFHNYCCLFDLELTKIRPKTQIDHPISVSKCFVVDRKSLIQDNGRLVSCDHIVTTITEQDYFTYRDFYTWDSMKVANLIIYPKDYLPRQFILAIIDLYEKKTQLKGIKEREVDYMLSKNMLNAAYGMTVTDIVREEITYSNDSGQFSSTRPNLDSAIDKYNKNIRRFLFYPWGVWVTSYSRRNLFTGILECSSDYVYSDTDSVKIKNHDKHKKYFDTYNKNIIQKLDNMAEYYRINKNRLKPKNIKGVEKPIGVWEFEGTYARFKTLGAKRYLTESQNGELSITVAGVNKKTAAEYLVEKYDDPFEGFTDQLVVPVSHSGRNIVTYIDEPYETILVDYTGVPARVSEKSCIHMEGTDYSLEMTMDYLKYVLGVRDASW